MKLVQAQNLRAKSMICNRLRLSVFSLLGIVTVAAVIIAIIERNYREDYSEVVRDVEGLVTDTSKAAQSRGYVYSFGIVENRQEPIFVWIRRLNFSSYLESQDNLRPGSIRFDDDLLYYHGTLVSRPTFVLVDEFDKELVVPNFERYSDLWAGFGSSPLAKDFHSVDRVFNTLTESLSKAK